MPDYKQSDLTGTQWQRCKAVVINNPLVGPKDVLFQEERVISLGGQNLRQPLDGCSKKFSTDGIFPLLDPTTNLPTGVSMTHTDLYVALYSLYMQTAMERDIANTP
jgi:hypothetical protein